MENYYEGRWMGVRRVQEELEEGDFLHEATRNESVLSGPKRSQNYILVSFWPVKV